MLSMWLEALIAVVVSIGVVISVLLGSETMHLLRASSELIRATIPAHWHYPMSAYFNS